MPSERFGRRERAQLEALLRLKPPEQTLEWSEVDRVDQERLWWTLRGMDRARLMSLLARALDEIPTERLESVLGTNMRAGDIGAPREQPAPSVLVLVEKFCDLADREHFYEEVNYRGSHQSPSTELFVAQFSTLMGRCAEDATDAPRDAADAFEMLFDLMRRIDDRQDRIVYFTDEAGSWQLAVCWPKVLPAYFSSLASTLTKHGYERRVDSLLERFGRGIQSSGADLRALAVEAWQRKTDGRSRPENGKDGPAASTATLDATDADVDLDLEKPVDLAIVTTKRTAARCRVLGSSQAITLRTSMDDLVPGHIVTVKPNKCWKHRGHPYLTGDVARTRVDANALGLTPFALHDSGEWDPAREYWGEDGEPPRWARPIIARGPRPLVEMEQVVPGDGPDNLGGGPILEAVELRSAGDTEAAAKILNQLLEIDLRCLDAHAHLGNLRFDCDPGWALSHYEVGLRIGELSLGDDFDGVLAWGLIDNRPFLRCLHGYALCLWRLERWKEAKAVFERMLWLNPSDNQGVRFCLPKVRSREAWTDDDY